MALTREQLKKLAERCQALPSIYRVHFKWESELQKAVPDEEMIRLFESHQLDQIIVWYMIVIQKSGKREIHKLAVEGFRSCEADYNDAISDFSAECLAPEAKFKNEAGGKVKLKNAAAAALKSMYRGFFDKCMGATLRDDAARLRAYRMELGKVEAQEEIKGNLNDHAADAKLAEARRDLPADRGYEELLPRIPDVIRFYSKFSKAQGWDRVQSPEEVTTQRREKIKKVDSWETLYEYITVLLLLISACGYLKASEVESCHAEMKKKLEYRRSKALVRMKWNIGMKMAHLVFKELLFRQNCQNHTCLSKVFKDLCADDECFDPYKVELILSNDAENETVQSNGGPKRKLEEKLAEKCKNCGNPGHVHDKDANGFPMFHRCPKRKKMDPKVECGLQAQQIK